MDLQLTGKRALVTGSTAGDCGYRSRDPRFRKEKRAIIERLDLAAGFPVPL